MAQRPVPHDLQAAFDEQLAVVHRKHKRRQGNFGPSLALMDELFVVIDGELEILAAGKWWPAPARTFACFRQGWRYGIRHKPGHKGRAHIVNILFDAPVSWLPQLPPPPLRLSAPWWRRFMDLESACDYDATGQRVLALSAVMGFVERLVQAALAPGQPARAQLPDEGPQRPDTCAEWMELWARAEDVVHQRAAQGLTVDELAEAVNVSPTQLRRIYHAARGISPKAALTQWRIEQARKLLAGGKNSVTQVAALVGFATVQRFSAAFKAKTGQSPVAFARAQ